MAQDDYHRYLAVQVLNEQQYISYRSLSRALKVHCNLAKQMLYDFHRKENGKRTGSVHATYLVSGTKRPAQSHGTFIGSQDADRDSIMHSSPPLPSSSAPRREDEDEVSKPPKTIMLVKERDLDVAKQSFEYITGLHIYSLQAGPIRDFHVLTECNQKIAADHATDDPLYAWAQYGIIQNPCVRRRMNRRPAPSSAAASATHLPPPTTNSMAVTKDAVAGSRPTHKDGISEPTTNTSSNAVSRKRQGDSIFKAFAKGATKPKKPDAQGVVVARPSLSQDVPMAGFSDDEDAGVDGGLPDEVEGVTGTSGKSRQQREDELNAMMEAEDEPMDDAGVISSPEDEVTIDKTATKEIEPSDAISTESGRRRGRRRVTKKKTVKDEDGYLVTKEETVWESFSEDEPVPKKPKISAPIPPGKLSTAVTKKGGNASKGNIMSFFSKK